MALVDYENQECLCAWLAALGSGPKQQLKNFITGAKVLIQAAQTVWLLVNAPYEDMYKKQLAEATLTIYQTATGPIEASMKYLVTQSSPFSDCPPVANLGKTIKDISGAILGPVKKMEFEIEQFIEAIDINNSQSEYLNRLIGNLDDVLDAIENC